MGKIAANPVARGEGWSVVDVVCTSGPHDRSYEEQHGAVTIALVVAGSFQYRAGRDSELMVPGSVLLGNQGQAYQCRHDHGTGDRCVSFAYAPEFFERAGERGCFKLHRLPPLAVMAPWAVQAKLALQQPEYTDFEELAHGFALAVLDVAADRGGSPAASASDERRISSVIRFIEANIVEPLPLKLLASEAKMSTFHFLRVFKQITSVTPHQYLLRARLRDAAIRLRSTRRPILEIALDCGFRDLSNFNHAFRAEFGANPTGFRGGS